MPILKQDLEFGIRHRINVLLSLRAAVTRGKPPGNLSLEESEEQERELARIRQQFQQAGYKIRHLNQENQRLKQENQELRQRDAKTAELKRELEGHREDGHESLEPSTDAQIFFLVGHGRSGTTWLQSILDSHPEILCQGEGWVFNRNYRREDFRELNPNLKVSSLYNAILTSEYLRLWIERSIWGKGASVEEHLDSLTNLSVNYFLTRKLRGTGKRIVGDKTASPGIETLEEIPKVCPDAKVVNIVRDGRDVAVSVAHFLWNHSMNEENGIYELNDEEIQKREEYRRDPSTFEGKSLFSEKRLAEIATGWASEVSRAAERGPELLGDNYLEARYENLLTQPETEVKRILGFLGADSSEQSIRECVDATGFEQMSSRKSGQEDSSSVRFRKGVAGDWKNVFTERDKQIFKEHAGDSLVKLGYESDNDW